ncbi:phosphodiesterase [Roseovarius sp. 2305UL8-3]|uniref:phosphodiesterase n=1 Tax=Roseovarius conchicola TaxID=3121636 RepID=UPI00352793B7
MQKLLVFTDIHFVKEGRDIIGLDPVARFSQGLAHALATHPDASHVIITGDLAHYGSSKEYARLRAALADCPIPVAMTIGNHDIRAKFRAAFPEAPVDENGFVQTVIDAHGYRLILLDTADEEAEIQHSGLLCEARLSWLEDRLTEASDTPTILFMHHPPILTGFDGMDHIGLRNRAELIQWLRAHQQVKQIVAGHVHRTISGSAGGIPTAIFKSPCHQMPMSLGDDDHHVSIDEPGAYGMVLLQDDQIIVHTEDFTLNPLPPASAI